LQRSALTPRRVIASASVVAIAASTLTIAALHPGFPVKDVDLTSRDVWVTNATSLLGGRLNKQIDELNGSVQATSSGFDVLQDGDTLLLVDPDAHRLDSVDPATTSITSSIELPPDAEVAFGGTVISILAPDGRLWAVSSVGDLRFDPATVPLVELGEGAHATVTVDGVVLAVSPERGELVRLDTLASAPVVTAFPKVGEFQLAAVGDRPVVFDESTNELVFADGRTVALGVGVGIRLQQTGPSGDTAVVATGDGLVRVALDDGALERISADIASTTNADAVAAPVNQDGCAHGAWGPAQRYLLVCEGSDPVTQNMAEPSGRLEFRVNRSVVVLNDLDSGNVWLPAENMRLVDNWDDVTPPEQQEIEEEGDEKSSQQSFEDALAERSDDNRPPTAAEDEFGIRPARTTILPVLDNDSDPDGDVLVIRDPTPVAEATGRLELIDGGRALQFTPAPGFTSTIRFDYTVDDGRGGSATAQVIARVVGEDENSAPLELRRSGVSVEANRTVAYNVLANWRDPDGDDLSVVSAAPRSGDLVRFTPDGFITFTHQTAELGEKEVVFQVTDGRGETVAGTLVVDVQAAGSLAPIATPDFATVFVGDAVLISPLANDLSPSGAELGVAAIEEPGDDSSVTLDTARNQVRFQTATVGIRYFFYTVQGGTATSRGIIRVDVLERPEQEMPPVAVKDTAFLRPGEPVTVSVLSNDVSPSGRILAVQSVELPAQLQATGLVVELLQSTLVRVTAPSALTAPVAFSYTISDGVHTSSAAVTIVPVPALTSHQPPLARDDRVTVRAGDIVTVHVLDNDTHPDDVAMSVDPELLTEPSDGIAFVNGDTVRFQAPDAAGEYRADYRILDAFGESAGAAVLFTVTPVDENANREPRPVPVVARVLAGNQLRIDLPLDGIDPDGDSVQLLRFPMPPALGTVIEQGPDHLVYEAAPGASGTDSFSYQVYDAFGATGTGDIDIAIIAPPDALSAPNAVPDSVSIRPGKLAQLDVTANDSDPQGSAIEVSETLIDVPDELDAKVVDGQYLQLVAPATEGSFSLRYELTNDRGGSSTTFVLVQVDADAPLTPPFASDVALTLAQIAGKKSVEVDLFDGYAFNPGGSNDDLDVSLQGPNAAEASLVTAGHGVVEVRPGQTRRAIAYRLTDPGTGLASSAFIIVPAAVEDDFDADPFIDPALPTQYVPMNERREWKLADVVTVPSGREVWIPDAASVRAVQSDGSPAFVDKGTIAFQGARDYRGPASITFTVTDGASVDDPKGNTIALTLPIVVGDPEFRDTPPEFTPPLVKLEVGETQTIDLRASTAQPNPQILNEVTYSELGGATSLVSAQLSGSTLTLSSPRTAPKGTAVDLDVTLRWGDFTVPGVVRVVLVGSSRPLPIAADDTVETRHGDGAVVVDPFINDMNPYASTGEPLTLVDAQLDNAAAPATISTVGDQVRVTPNPTLKAGTIVVVYTIEDATHDRDRRVNGTITVVVSDVPDQPLRPERDGGTAVGGDGTATIRFSAPATNGKPITVYELTTSPAVTTPTDCVAGAACTISGLANGTAYSFSVRAINEHGAGPWSPASDPITPYGTPARPVVTATATDPWAGQASPGVISASWPAVAGTGGTTSYHWSVSAGPSGMTTGLTTGPISVAAGSYTVTVYAANDGGRSGSSGSSSAVVVTQQTALPVPGAPATTVTNNAEWGAITWTWSPAVASSGGSANVGYEVSLNGGAATAVSGTSYSVSGLAAGDYRLRVRASNKAGTTAWSADSAPGTVIIQSNATTKRRACLLDTDDYFARQGCQGTAYADAGTPIWVDCRGSSGGIWYLIIGRGRYAGMWILESDVNYGPTRLSICP
jgi:hypothetical protein